MRDKNARAEAVREDGPALQDCPLALAPNKAPMDAARMPPCRNKPPMNAARLPPGRNQAARED